MESGFATPAATRPTKKPALTIGMPVYNGARYLDRALDSLLAQSFKDFELLISDNASTDSTPAICDKFAARDSRVHVVRTPINRGAAWNFNHVADRAAGEFFVWAAHDDEWHPDFIDRCVDVLNRRPNVVCCYSFFQPIDDEGLAHSTARGVGCEAPTRRARWNKVLRDWQIHGSIYGVMRAAALRRTRGMLARTSSDLIFMAELLLHGDLAVLPEPLHRKRMPKDGSFRSVEEVLIALGASLRGAGLFNRYHVMREEIAGLQHAALPCAEERALRRDAIVHYLTSRSWRHDGLESVYQLIGVQRSQGLRRRARAVAEGLGMGVGRR